MGRWLKTELGGWVTQPLLPFVRIIMSRVVINLVPDKSIASSRMRNVMGSCSCEPCLAKRYRRWGLHVRHLTSFNANLGLSKPPCTLRILDDK